MTPSEGADQHQQGGAGQVEVGEQEIYRLEREARTNEQIGLAVRRLMSPCAAMTDSRVRTTVVPTATIRPPSDLVPWIADAASSEISKRSKSMR